MYAILLPVRLIKEVTMNMLSTTKLSSKGQVVIPEDIRDKIGLETGAQFIVVADKDVVILKIIKQPNLKEFTSLVTKARRAAKKAGLTKASLKQTIKEARSRS
jgi:AbrB family looped-hinge helix DNA binding protein